MSGDRPDPRRQAETANDGPQTRGLRAVLAMLPWRLHRRINEVEAEIGGSLDRIQDRIESRLNVVDERAGRMEGRLDGIEASLAEIVGKGHARDLRLDGLEGRNDDLDHRLDQSLHRIDAAEDDLRGLQAMAEDRLTKLEGAVQRADAEIARLRDGLVPAAVRRSDLLLDRLAFELEETSSLVERMLRREPLPLPEDSAAERAVAAGLSEAVPDLVDAFRGSEEEIAHRLQVNIPLVREHAPVLDLGCGRGELLILLREEGISARGVERDPALVQSARRRGLEIVEDDVLSALQGLGDGEIGAVTALHLFEHLPTTVLARVLAEVRRVLRPGGVLLVECPNPHNLRVGASLFWLDPTHLRPLLPETLDLALRAAGFEVGEVRYRHPFPDEQSFRSTADFPPSEDGEIAARFDRIERRLDELLNGPRDFSIVATKDGA